MQSRLRNTRAFHSYTYACDFVVRLRIIQIQPGQHIVYSCADRVFKLLVKAARQNEIYLLTTIR